MWDVKLTQSVNILLHDVDILLFFFVDIHCRSPGGDAVAQAPSSEESILFLGGDEHRYAGGSFHMY